MLTKGNFTRDEWNNLHRLFKISHFSSPRCTKKNSLISCNTIAKRFQESKTKTRPAVVNVSCYLIATSSSAASSPIASKSPGISGASGKPDTGMRMNPNLFDAASTSQVRLQDAYLGGLMEEQRGKPPQKEEDSDSTILKLRSGSTKGIKLR